MNRERRQRVDDVRIHHHRVDVDHRAHRVEMHLRPLLRDRHGQHGVRQIIVEQAARQRLRAGRRGPLPHSRPRPRPAPAAARRRPRRAPIATRTPAAHPGTAGDARRSGRSATSRERVRASASDVIATRGPIQNDESRVNSRFGSGSMTKSPPWCIRRTNDSSPPLNGNSLNVIPAISTDASGAASSVRRYVESSCANGSPSRRGSTAAAMPCMRAAPLLASASVNRSASSSTSTPREPAARRTHRAPLRLGHPRQPVEQQRVVVARGQPLQFGAGAVQDDGAQPANLGIAAQRHI